MTESAPPPASQLICPLKVNFFLMVPMFFQIESEFLGRFDTSENSKLAYTLDEGFG